MSGPEWPFDQDRNVAAIATWEVLRERAPVTVVIHYSDDHSWAFLGGDRMDPSDGAVVCMSEVPSLDPTLLQIADLEPGWVATRSHVGGEWTREFDPEM